MDLTWELPDENFIKINVFCIISEVPLPNGNTLGVGVIARNDGGENLWNAMGTMANLSEEQALLSGIQSACIEAKKKDWKLLHIETSNRDVFDTIIAQHHIILREDQREAYALFNTVHANNRKNGRTDRCISCVPASMNGTARYLAEYGMRNMSEFAEFKGMIGDLSYHLDRDMGMALMSPLLEVGSNMGEGEVIDAPKPPSPVRGHKRKFSTLDRATPTAHPSFVPTTLSLSILGSSLHANRDKGKSKLYKDYAFNDDGVVCPRAIKMMEEGKLAGFNDFFKHEVVDMDVPLLSGIYARDVLHHAVQGTLHSLLADRSSQWDSFSRMFLWLHAGGGGSSGDGVLYSPFKGVQKV
ncbi:hypothetical protein DCAR_0312057 [Daucus carota subsp. sativus]|uniref:Uncharacterized protein n=1 Tax=Daucus carota subsp. sativus TaxID=79200 RepID=A0A169W9S1_DAUCS|nr:hypothetical protein DCAR_0312057 [Daucus carota subsp. sativus]